MVLELQDGAGFEFATTRVAIAARQVPIAFDLAASAGVPLRFQAAPVEDGRVL